MLFYGVVVRGRTTGLENQDASERMGARHLTTPHKYTRRVPLMVRDWTFNSAKIGKANSMYLKERNSQYGSEWITNGFQNAKIKKGTHIPEGFWKGRIINK